MLPRASAPFSRAELLALGIVRIFLAMDWLEQASAWAALAPDERGGLRGTSALALVQANGAVVAVGESVDPGTCQEMGGAGCVCSRRARAGLASAWV